MTLRFTRLRYWESRALRFALSAVVVFLLVAAVGWATNTRHLLHALLYSVGAIAFLPLVFIAGALAFLMLLAIAAGFAGAEVDPMDEHFTGEAAEGGIRLIRPYYRFLGRQRHPLVLGSIVGLLFGCFGLWLFIAVVITPKETETAELMAEIQSDLDASYSTQGGFPEDVDGKLLRNATRDSGNDDLLVDAFGRDFVYESEQSGGTASYRLRSLGYDAVVSHDDLCIAGETTRAQRLLNRATRVAASLVERLTGEAVSWGDKVTVVRELRCADPN